MSTSYRRRGGLESPRPSRLARRQLLVVACSLALTATAASVASASPAATSATTAASQTPIIFGASGGSEVDALQAKVGTALARHSFGQLQGKVPPGRLVNMAPNVSWRTIAAANSGSSVYADIVRWADTLKSRQGITMFTFSHEPEGSSSDGLGTSSEFIAAFRRVHDIFKSRGVANVEYTWNMTSNSFRVSSNDPRSAPEWYPGDAYVDNVASAAYNWYNCGEGKGLWLSLADRAAAPLAFAKSHDKQLVLAEWASQKDPRRTQWLRDARQWFLANRSAIRAAFYYQSPNPRPGCSWMLTSSEEISAFADMARDRTNFGP